MFVLTSRRALVTGASSGLGAHFASILAKAGAHVTLGARRIEALEGQCAAITAGGNVAEPVALDVTDRASIDAVFANADAPFDIVVNCAGIPGGGSALEMSAQEWQRVLDTNLSGAFHVAQAAAQAMQAPGRGGSIVNIASILGLRQAGGVAAYAASKAGLIQLTKALALEWARHGIRVNALCPGYIETPLNADFFSTPAGAALIKRIPQRRLGRMDELNAPLLLLCSDAGSYITGATLAVDGGHLVSTL